MAVLCGPMRSLGPLLDRWKLNSTERCSRSGGSPESLLTAGSWRQNLAHLDSLASWPHPSA